MKTSGIVPQPLTLLTLLVLTLLLYAEAEPGLVVVEECPKINLSGFVRNITCGTIEVPLSYDRMQGETLSIWFALINGDLATPKAQALSIIPGGPGGAASNFIPALQVTNLSVLSQPFVLVDGRGTGLSQALQCNALMNSSVSETLPMATLTNCGREIGPRRIYFSSANTARDLETARQALNVEKWNLIGLSAGTQPLRYYAKYFPGNARTLVLDGAFLFEEEHTTDDLRVQDFKAKLNLVCNRTSSCAASRYLQNLASVLKNLRRFPNEKVTPVDLAGTILSVEFERLSNLTKALENARDGNYTMLENFFTLQKTTPRVPVTSFSQALSLSTTCLESELSWNFRDSPTVQLAKFEDRILQSNGKLFYPFLPEEVLRARGFDNLCLGWPRLPEGVSPSTVLDRLEGEIETGSTPALFITGELDLVTPVRIGRRAAAQFSNAKFVEIANVGHPSVTQSECALQLVIDFVLNGQFPETQRCGEVASQPISP